MSNDNHSINTTVKRYMANVEREIGLMSDARIKIIQRGIAVRELAISHERTTKNGTSISWFSDNGKLIVPTLKLLAKEIQEKIDPSFHEAIAKMLWKSFSKSPHVADLIKNGDYGVCLSILDSYLGVDRSGAGLRWLIDPISDSNEINIREAKGMGQIQESCPHLFHSMSLNEGSTHGNLCEKIAALMRVATFPPESGNGAAIINSFLEQQEKSRSELLEGTTIHWLKQFWVGGMAQSMDRIAARHLAYIAGFFATQNVTIPNLSKEHTMELLRHENLCSNTLREGEADLTLIGVAALKKEALKWSLSDNLRRESVLSKM